MEYVQEAVTTLHDFDARDGDPDPLGTAPTGDATVVVPLTGDDHGSPAAEGVFETLSSLSVESVVVPLRATPAEADRVTTWLDAFGCDPDVLWCNAPAMETLLADHGLDGDAGKGRDVWLALGVAAARSEYVVVHDADAKSYAPTHVPRLLFPLAHGHDFAKGYYARVERGRLYGRLFRLFYAPLLRALRTAHGAPVLDYLDAFRYPLAGEFAVTADLARRFRVQRGWGLEVGTLGDAFDVAGFDASAQVDLGIHRHEHRSVSGEGGLGRMAREVGQALFHVLGDHGVAPDYGTLPDRYRRRAERLVDQYATDAAFNGLDYDRQREREQVATYADAIHQPVGDARLPAWTDAPLAAERVEAVAREALARPPER